MRVRASGVVLGLEHLAATVEAGRADVVTQVSLAGGRLDRDARHRQRVVRTVHAPLGRGLLVLLNGHVGLLERPAPEGAAAMLTIVGGSAPGTCRPAAGSPPL